MRRSGSNRDIVHLFVFSSLERPCSRKHMEGDAARCQSLSRDTRSDIILKKKSRQLFSCSSKPSQPFIEQTPHTSDAITKPQICFFFPRHTMSFHSPLVTRRSVIWGSREAFYRSDIKKASLDELLQRAGSGERSAEVNVIYTCC